MKKKFAHKICRIDLHLGREFTGEEGNQQEVELPIVGEVFDAGVAKPDGLTFCLRE